MYILGNKNIEPRVNQYGQVIITYLTEIKDLYQIKEVTVPPAFNIYRFNGPTMLLQHKPACSMDLQCNLELMYMVAW